MADESALQRAWQLYELDRYDAAAELAVQVLGQRGDDAEVLALLALCQIQLKKLKDALGNAERAIAADPEERLGYLARAMALYADHRFDLAEQAAKDGLLQDASEAEYYAIMAQCRAQREDYKKALELARQGMALDPTNKRCQDLEAGLLSHLGRRDEAQAALAANLSQHPDDPNVHAAQGWQLLREGDRRGAREHFATALRIAPNHESAAQGMITCIKAGNPFYRIFLSYLLWITSKGAVAQWLLILGGMVVYRIASTIMNRQPEWTPVVLPLVIIYLTFAVMTWLIIPLSDLLLLAHPFGRLVLPPAQRSRALICAIPFVIGLIGLGFLAVTGQAIGLLVGLAGGMLTGHLHTAVAVDNPRHQKQLTIGVLALSALAIAAIVNIHQDNVLGVTLWEYFTFAWIGYMFFAGYLTNRGY